MFSEKKVVTKFCDFLVFFAKKPSVYAGLRGYHKNHNFFSKSVTIFALYSVKELSVHRLFIIVTVMSLFCNRLIPSENIFLDICGL